MSEQRLLEAAALRHGAFTRSDARAEDLSERQIDYRLARGRWIPLHRGVYSVAGTPITWHGRLVAACAAIGPPSLASHRAAGRVWQFPKFHDAPVEITTVPGRGRALRGVVVHQCAGLLPEDQSVVDGVPVTGPELTLIHLAGAVGARQIEGLIDHAFREKLATERNLRGRVDALARSGRNGIGILRAVLDLRTASTGTPAESPLEREFLRIIGGSDLPRPRTQHVVRDEVDGFIARVDAAWPEARLAVELDGRTFHAPLQRWNDDLERQNALVALGWTVLRFTWWDVHDRSYRVLKTLRQTLARAVSELCA